MSIIRLMGLLALIGLASAQVKHFMPTSEVVRVASMAAEDEGYVIKRTTFLDEMRTPEGKEPYPGYTTIGLYRNDRLLREYSIRIDTGDIVDPLHCKSLRYPNLLLFQQQVLVDFGTRPPTLNQIATEVGCNDLELVPAPTQKGGTKKNREIK